jgi:hypothetical protein
VWASSSRIFGGNDVGDDDLEENDDSEEDDISNFMNDISKMVDGVNMSNNSNTKSNGKKK